ncbi:hypothetical protein B0T17DRAFT_516632 [Bombardia bombarda]|uniref:DNA replication factor Cdt1 C-terminal domain-containing protein n=1 Tax=Bombardia bombarda TaxID=252184 RepID=A0AA39XK77_9PEZI|nr:hypothetical protein B0T17DRAFT_516632 [Bombardia bombarda]
MPGLISRPKRTPRGKLATPSKLPAASSIANFARISKLRIAAKDLNGKSTALDSGRTSSIEIVLSSRKRKVEDDDLEPVAPSSTDNNSTPSKKPRRETVKAKPIAELLTPITRKKKTRQFQADSDDESDSRNNERDHKSPEPEALLERLNLQSPVRKRTKTTLACESISENDFDLPRELVDLLDMHTALLKTLTMEMAHNGASTPVDLCSLLPSVTRAWGRRAVTLDDIRRCIGILNWRNPLTKGSSTSNTPATAAPFYLSDYGRNKICIEQAPTAEPGPLREQKLNMDFEANLRALWLARRPDQPVQPFINILPSAPIKPCPSAAKALPLLARRQQALDELKNGVVRKQQEKQAKAVVQAEVKAAAVNPDGTKMSLLDRVRLKESQLLAQGGPSGPSPAELQRRAALQRAEDVAAVVGMLCATSGSGLARMAFTMSALMIKLKDSLRTPISQEDGMACVRLLAGEIAPQWLRIVTVGGRENVVVQTGFQPARGVVQERVQKLLG